MSDPKHASGHSRIKGAAVKELLTWYAARVGPNEVRRILERVPQHHRGELDAHAVHFGVLPSTWYSAAAIHAVLDAILEDTTAQQRETLCHDGARAVLDGTLKNGIYRGLFNLIMTPDRYARYAQKLWSRYYDDGRIEKEHPEPGWCNTIVRHWSAHHPFMCDLNVASSEYIYGAMGCRRVVAIRTSCIADGGTDCRYTTKWLA